jgi:hypothetical protein
MQVPLGDGDGDGDGDDDDDGESLVGEGAGRRGDLDEDATGSVEPYPGADELRDGLCR